MDRYPGTVSLYEADYVKWLEQQIGLLGRGRFEQLDIPGVIEELESIVRQEKRSMRGHLEVLLMHLLKCACQPQRRTTSWNLTLDAQRSAILDIIEDSPSLRGTLAEAVARTYPRARRRAARETHLPLERFPELNPFDLDKLLDMDYVPEPID